MALINQDIKNFVMGISQQPSTLRNPEQLEEQLNGYSSEASGLQKRPPSLYVKTLQEYTSSVKPLIHFIKRDASEKYTVVFDGSGISVYDLAGNSYAVSYGNAASKDYITTDNPRTDLQCVTIADYTFITNKKKVVAMSSAVTPNVWASQGVLVNVKSGQYGRTYRVDINGSTVASYETPDGSEKEHVKNIATDYIANQLAAGARSAGWSVTTGSSWLYIYGGTISSVACYDGYNNQAMFGTYKTTQKFTNLPASAPDGFTCKVAGEEGSTSDDYYVKYNESENVWQECAEPNIPLAFDVATMPHVLIRKKDGDFALLPAEWSEREAGDEDSNPLPSFVGEKINFIFYFKNRLGFLAGENVILTRSADFFNFWMASAMNVQDTDPVDLAVSDNSIATLHHAVPFDAELIIFSENAQFSLQSEGVLSPKSAVLTPPVTHFGCSTKAKPISAGRNIYFIAERNEYATMREFYIANDNTDAKDAHDITSHVPNYIPNSVYALVGSDTENIILLLSDGEENAIYTYKYLFINGVRQQASWSKWSFTDSIYGASFIDSDLYLVLSRNKNLVLEKVAFTFNTEDYASELYRVLLDSKAEYEIPDTAYDSNLEETVIDLYQIYGNSLSVGATYGAVTDEGTYVETTKRALVLDGDYTGKTIIIGQPYNFKMTLSTIYVKQSSDNGTEALLEGRLQLRKLWFNYADSGYFKVDVNLTDKGSYTYVNNQHVIGTSHSVMDKVHYVTQKFDVPLQSLNTNCSVTLSSDKPQPVAIIGAGWIGNYNRRTRRY